MPLQQKIFAISVSVILFLVIIELVRRRRLREEYSVLWLLTGVVMIVMTLWYDLLLMTTRLIGAVLPTSTLFLLGVLFLMVISLYYSVKISELHDQVKDTAQEVAILQAQIQKLTQDKNSWKMDAS